MRAVTSARSANPLNLFFFFYSRKTGHEGGIFLYFWEVSGALQSTAGLYPHVCS